MKLRPRSIGMRLALLFALASTLVLGAISVWLYQSLAREIAWRDDNALAGRVERMRALVDDAASIDALRSRPQLYANMLGNRDSVLWLIAADGTMLIEINPGSIPVPSLPASDRIRLADASAGQAARLAWVDIGQGARRLRLVAGKMLAEREQMLSSYRITLGTALVLGAALSFALGWLITRQGLRPVRELAARAAQIDVSCLDTRLAAADAVRASLELQGLARALDQMLQRLGDGFAQLSRFSEDLAHEMRTPLSNLMGLTQQTLRKPRSPEQYQDLLVSNQEEYERLSRMIDSMLFLARSEQPGTAITREPIDLSAMAAQLVEYFEGLAQERAIAFALDVAGTLQADRQLVQRALANLLANALRYGAGNSTVTISTHWHADGVDLVVGNSGEPIGQEHLPHVFERFYRCDPARSTPGDSGGLGLAIVRSIMHLHGGEAGVTSGVDGTRFSLHFPQACAAPGVTRAIAHA